MKIDLKDSEVPLLLDVLRRWRQEQIEAKDGNLPIHGNVSEKQYDELMDELEELVFIHRLLRKLEAQAKA